MLDTVVKYAAMSVSELAFHMPIMTRLSVSSWVSFLVFTPLFLVAAYQDQTTRMISGWICTAIAAVLLIYNAAFSGLIGVAVVFVCSYFVFRDKECKYIGQADFLVFAHCITNCLFTYTSMAMLFLSLLCWLGVLFVYVALYRGPDGKKWSPGTTIPAMPAYAFSLILVGVLRITCTVTVFKAGY